MALTKVRTGGITDASVTTAKVANDAKNVPAFHASLSAYQTISNATETKVNFDTELFDSDGTYDNSSNYRFTPAVTGKYFIYACMRLDNSDDFNNFHVFIKKNGSTALMSGRRHTHYGSNLVSGIVDSDTNDYFEAFIYQDTGGNFNVRGNAHETYFGGFRITT